MDIIGDLVVIAVVLVGGVVHGLVMKFDLVPGWKVPFDGGRSWRGRQIFGPNKTWRGLVVMVASLTIAGGALFPLSPPGTRHPPWGWFALGAALGLAYIVAELPNSFVKRRLDIEAGTSTRSRGRYVQALTDQMDSVLGVVAALVLLVDLPWSDAVVLLVLGTAVHAGFDVLLHRSGAKATISPGGTST